MEKIMEIEVALTGSQTVEGQAYKICMLSFTGVTRGRYFTGRTVGEGVDTQKISKTGKVLLSARYLLEGTDYQGNSCRVFVENNGCEENGTIICKPQIVTDSPVLKEWETAELCARVEGTENGVLVSIYRVNDEK
ncbi:MAG: hypothetical protein ACOX8M_02185 [Marvinbryantia sp.]